MPPMSEEKRNGGRLRHSSDSEPGYTRRKHGRYWQYFDEAGERVQRLDLEGLQAAFIYPTIGLNWETECDDADYAQAMCRAYNRWLVDWCSNSGGRLGLAPLHI